MENFKTLPQAAQWHAVHTTAHAAFVFNDGAVSFEQYNENANRVANGLLAGGSLKGEKVAFLGKDSIYAYEILMGSAKAKAVFVPINWRLTSAEILYILEDAQATVLFVEQEFYSLIEGLLDKQGLTRTIVVIGAGDTHGLDYVIWRNQQPAGQPSMQYEETDAVVQVYTSGTTGNPKGVQLAHYTFFRMLQGAKAQGDTWMELGSEDVLLLAVPIFHIGGMWWALQCFCAGATGIIMDTFVAWKVLANIEKYRISKIAMVPAMIQFLLSEPDCKTTDFSSLKYILYGGSPITPALRSRAMQTFGCDFFQIYGMTETGNCAVTLRPHEHDDQRRKNAAGRPFHGVRIKIVDTASNEVPTGSPGEILIKSPSVMLGYWNNPEATEAILNQGWIRTGDGGYIDEEGFLYVCDRIKDMIISAGENIFPAEVEAAISEHPAVQEVAVIGVPDELWGEAVKAFIILKPGKSATARELVLFARERIADYKVPRFISFTETLPRNAAGKVLKKELREPYWNGRERAVN